MENLESAQLSKLVYGRNLDDYSKLGFHDGREVEVENDYVVIAVREKETAIVIEGSDSILDPKNGFLDWIDNFRIATINTKEYGKVHSGFYRAWMNMRHEVFDAFRRVHRPGNSIRFAGHSAGAAKGLFGAIDFKQNITWDVEIFTHGCPMVGKGEFCKAFNDLMIPHKRFVNGKDPVPRQPKIPLTYYTMGYRHNCKSINLKDGSFSFFTLGDPRDHEIDRYIRNLKNAV